MLHRVLVAAPEKIIRDGLKCLLGGIGGFSVIAEAEDGGQALQLSRSERPDIVLLDANLPGVNGIRAAAEIHRQLPGIRIVILSAQQNEDTVIGALQAGAQAVLTKNASAEELRSAVRAVAGGRTYLEPVAARLAADFREGQIPRERRPVTALTPRETEIVRLVAAGYTSKQISAILHLSVDTVRTYRKTVMRKLGANNAATLTHIAMSSGLTPLEDRGDASR